MAQDPHSRTNARHADRLRETRHCRRPPVLRMAARHGRHSRHGRPCCPVPALRRGGRARLRPRHRDGLRAARPARAVRRRDRRLLRGRHGELGAEPRLDLPRPPRRPRAPAMGAVPAGQFRRLRAQPRHLRGADRHHARCVPAIRCWRSRRGPRPAWSSNFVLSRRVVFR